MFHSKTKHCNFPGRKWLNVVNITPNCWLVTMRNGTISVVQCWFLLLTDLALSSSGSQVSFGEFQKFILSKPCRASMFSTMASVFTSTLDVVWKAGERRWLSTEWVLLCTWFLYFSFAEVTFTWKASVLISFVHCLNVSNTILSWSLSYLFFPFLPEDSFRAT